MCNFTICDGVVKCLKLNPPWKCQCIRYNYLHTQCHFVMATISEVTCSIHTQLPSTPPSLPPSLAPSLPPSPSLPPTLPTQGNSGVYNRTGLSDRTYNLRIEAQLLDQRRTIRRRLPVLSTTCSASLINRGVTIRNGVTTIEFSGSGGATNFYCLLDETTRFDPCEYK